MIPVRLKLSGFLSYREPVEISFENFSLACISGHNGAGKSSILDGITWALFGRARGKTDDDMINNHAQAAEVVLDFVYENDLYRVQRAKPRGKTSSLEFMIQDGSGHWRTLTEATQHATENRIQQVLRLDYETFTNASFFLQGKADQFSQQNPGERKRILSSVLGLEIWETYRLQAAKAIRQNELEKTAVVTQITANNEELDRKPEYEAEVNRLETELEHLNELLKSKNAARDAAIQQENALKSLQKALDQKTSQVNIQRQRLLESQQRYEERTREQSRYRQLLDAAPQIENAYSDWLAARRQLEHWESLAEKQRVIEQKRATQQSIIDNKATELQAILNGLRKRQAEKENWEAEFPSVEQSLNQLISEAESLAAQNQRKADLDEKRQTLRLKVNEIEINGQGLSRELGLLNERIARLGESEDETCPVCKKPLNARERQNMIQDLQGEKSGLEILLRENTDQLQAGRAQVKSVVDVLNTMTNLELRIQQNHQDKSRAEARLTQLRELIENYQLEYHPQLTAVESALRAGDFEPAARQALQQLERETIELGYDAAAHESVRQAELSGRSSEEEKRSVDAAQAALIPLERNISELAATITAEQQTVDNMTAELQRDEQEVNDLKALLPDLSKLEREVQDLKVQANRKNMDLGGAQARLKNLDNIRARQTELILQRDDIARQNTLLKKLEHAFSKDGVPALLIEQALPEIETQANELLDRLSNGSMSLHFETQAVYKDAKRADKKETLDIKISDSSGNYREYNMYSGGEAFRVNFALRLALSRVLAHRAGARLQTLVIDEGFGSQDADGRQRLIEAINQVRSDFQKILVITHLDELKDSFPARIEVEKSAAGSTVSVQVS
jgi:exonuclease SbcC